MKIISLFFIGIFFINSVNSEKDVRELRYRDYSIFRGRKNVTLPKPPYPQPPFIDYPQYLEEQTLPPPP